MMLRRARIALLICAGCALAALPLNAGVLWYNGDGDGNWWNNQNHAPEHQIIWNDFVVDTPWIVESVWSNDSFNQGLPTQATWEIWKNVPRGTFVAGGANAAVTLTLLSGSGASAVYQVEVTGLYVTLQPDTYWLAVYPDNNTGIAVTSETTGLNAVGTPPGNNGNTYFLDYYGNVDPIGFDTSAGVGGDLVGPEPSYAILFPPILLLGASFLMLRRAKAKVMAASQSC